jgi:hypothetical protein
MNPAPRVVTVTEIELVYVTPPAETLDCPEVPTIPDDATLAGWGLFDLYLLYLDTWRVASLCKADVEAAAEFVNRPKE